MASNEETRTLLQQGPGRKSRNAQAATLPHTNNNATLAPVTDNDNGLCSFVIVAADGNSYRLLRLTGRVRWALEMLMDAGLKGCTAISAPAPRWAAYVHRLRQMGVLIETITEPHEGAFPGTHARYVLRSEVRRVSHE
jgi:hypothetical protein